MSRWVSKKVLRKNKYVRFSSSSRVHRVYLPSYTQGLSFKNTNVILGNVSFSTRDAIHKMEVTVDKRNDNEFNVTSKVSSFKYSGFRAPLFVKSGSSFIINPTLTQGIRLESYGSLQGLIFVGVTVRGNPPVQVNLDLYIGGERVRSFTEHKVSGDYDKFFVGEFSTGNNNVFKEIKIVSTGRHDQSYHNSYFMYYTREGNQPTEFNNEYGGIFFEESE